MSPQVAVSKKPSEPGSSPLGPTPATSSSDTLPGTGHIPPFVFTSWANSSFVKRQMLAPVQTSTIQMPRPRVRDGSYPPLTTAIQRSSYPRPAGSCDPLFVTASFTGPIGGGRGAKPVHDCPIMLTSIEHGCGYVHRNRGVVGSVTSSDTYCVPPERSDITAIVWNS